MNTIKTHVIETERLRMRPLIETDLDTIISLNSDPEVMKHITGGKAMPPDQTRSRFDFYIDQWQKHEFGLYMIEYKNTFVFAGICGLQYLDNTEEIEVGYRLTKDSWGKGIATESARASLQFGFDHLKLDRIVAVVDPDNLPSQRVLEKIGLRYEKPARHYNADLMYYAINRDEFKT